MAVSGESFARLDDSSCAFIRSQISIKAAEKIYKFSKKSKGDRKIAALLPYHFILEHDVIIVTQIKRAIWSLF